MTIILTLRLERFTSNLIGARLTATDRHCHYLMCVVLMIATTSNWHILASIDSNSRGPGRTAIYPCLP
jgi:hypothetical protein